MVAKIPHGLKSGSDSGQFSKSGSLSSQTSASSTSSWHRDSRFGEDQDGRGGRRRGREVSDDMQQTTVESDLGGRSGGEGSDRQSPRLDDTSPTPDHVTAVAARGGTPKGKACGWLECRRPRINIRVAGPSLAGKTTLVRWLKHRQFTEVAPSSTMEVDMLDVEGQLLVTWDSRHPTDDHRKCPITVACHWGSKSKEPYRPATMSAIIYVVDASDPGRLNIAARALKRLLRRMHTVPYVLVLACKWDKQGCVSVNYIQQQLQLTQVAYDRDSTVLPCSAVTGEGIDSAMEWLLKRIREDQTSSLCGCLDSLGLTESNRGTWLGNLLLYLSDCNLFACCK